MKTFPADITRLGRGRAQKAILAALHGEPRGQRLTDMTRGRAFIGMHFAQIMTSHEELCLELPAPEGLSLIATIDTIRQLRFDADSEEAACTYDPQGFTARRVAAQRAHADLLEQRMEARLGWNCAFLLASD